MLSWVVKKKVVINGIAIVEYKCPHCGFCETVVNHNKPSKRCFVCENELKEIDDETSN